MKKCTVICCLVASLAFAGCKTSEANYRAAYETAMEKKTSAVGEDVESELAKESSPKTVAIGEVELPTIDCRLYAVAAEGANAVTPMRYSVAVAKFRQLFNARSLCRRMRDGGYDGALVAMDREKTYYVLAGTTADAGEAAALLKKTESGDVFKAKSPFPCVIVSR